MLDPLSSVPWGSLTTFLGLVAFITVSMVRGWLVPKSTHERELAFRDSIIAELRRTNEVVDARNDRLSEQIRILTDGVRTSNAVVTALPAVVGKVA